jgi:hypothetical protein
LASCPVLRIDVFITQTGELIVNEVEGLEAYIPAVGRKGHIIDNIAITFLNDYWKNKYNSMMVHAIEYLINNPNADREIQYWDFESELNDD